MTNHTFENGDELFSRDGHLTELTINRILSAEIDIAEVDSHVDDCALCTERLEAMRAEDAAFDASDLSQPAWLSELTSQSPDAAPVVDLAERRRNDVGQHGEDLASKTNIVPWLGAAVAMAAAIALIATFTLDGEQVASDVDDGIRLKGRSLTMEVYAKGDGEARHVGNGEAAFPGERVAFKIYPRSAGHAMILGIDDKGSQYQCFPQGADKISSPVEPTPGGVELDAAMKLDAVLGTERLVAVLCPEPFTYAELAPKLKEQASTAGDKPVGQLKDGCEQHEVKLIKQAPDTP